MYRMIACDYDNTLVPAGKTLSSAFFTKVTRMGLCGTLFVLASGRPYNQVKKLLNPLSQQIAFLCNDGALVMYRNCVLYKKPVEQAAAKAISAFALNEGMTPIAALREENHRVTPEKLALPFFFSTDVFKLIIVKNGKDTQELKQKAANAHLRICYEDDAYLEFCREDVNKGEALQALMQKFSVARQDLLALGDGINDLPMLQLTENRVVPAGAQPAVRALTENIVPDVERFLLEL